MELYIYKGAFKVEYAKGDEMAKKVKLTGHNKRDAFNTKHKATDRMASTLDIKAKRMNDRKAQRAAAKAARQ